MVADYRSSKKGGKGASTEPHNVVERQGDAYASQGDMNSLRHAFIAYFSASVAYKLTDNRTAYQRAIKKGNEMGDRIAKETGSTRQKVINGLLEDMAGGLEKHPKSRKKPLIAFLGLGSIIAGLFLLSANVTGNVISLTATPSNWIGAMLFIIGLAGLTIYFRKRSL